jgi:hypothetical protein
LLRLIVSAIAGCLLASGCASVGTANVEPAYRPSTSGLLVVSVTASGYNPGTLWYQIVRSGAVAHTVASIPVNDRAYGLDWEAGDPAVPNSGAGRVAVIELGPGEYEMRRWVINVANRAAFISTKPFGFRFEIEAGKATYLGNVHVDIQRTADPDTLPFAVALEDRRDRDLAILHRKYPGVRKDQLIFGGPGRLRETAAERPVGLGPTRLDDLQNLLPGK